MSTLIQRLQAELAAVKEDRDHNYSNWMQALDRNQELLKELETMRARGESNETTKSYIAVVPDHCDRITWRGKYFHLPIDAGSASGTVTGANETGDY